MILKNCQSIWQIVRHVSTQIVTTFARLFYRQTVLILAILLGLGAIGAVWSMSRLSTNLIESQAIQNAALYAQAVKEARTLYSSEAVSRVKAGGLTASHDYLNQPKTIPLPATYLIEPGEYVVPTMLNLSLKWLWQCKRR